MTRPRLAAVVGPSGAGKDSLIAALAAADPRLRPVRRVITRTADGTEPFQSVTPEEFEALAEQDAFLLFWTAHRLRYGIPRTAVAALTAGETGLVNLSRGVLDRAAALVPDLVVLSVTAPVAVLAERLSRRGREAYPDILDRLARSRPAPPTGLRIVTVDNGGDLDHAVGVALAALSGPVP